MFGLKGQELLIILIILLLVFGARKLPELARSLGSSAKEFRKGIEEGNVEDTPSTSPLQDRAVDVSMTDTQPPDS
ncbi:MAG: twin-arginine translocase TatA/TatE family subunit [Acidimicrobiia bacterium]